jgi:hypothetical protein
MRHIKVTFNSRKQWVMFHVGISLRKFRNENQCHAYYVPADVRLKRRGLFGHVYIPETSDTMFSELVSHEIAHAVHDWFLCRKGGDRCIIKNEELFASMTGEIARKFWRKYNHI